MARGKLKKIGSSRFFFILISQWVTHNTPPKRGILLLFVASFKHHHTISHFITFCSSITTTLLFLFSCLLFVDVRRRWCCLHQRHWLSSLRQHIQWPSTTAHIVKKGLFSPHLSLISWIWFALVQYLFDWP